MAQTDAGPFIAIDVSPEMRALVGCGSVGPEEWPTGWIGLEILFGDCRTPARLRYFERWDAEVDAEAGESRIVQLVDPQACERLFGGPLGLAHGAVRYLSAGLQQIAIAIRDCRLPPNCATPYRLAKNIELLCELIEAARTGILDDSAPQGLSTADRERIAAARQMIERQWHEKLTLDQIARACGINRSKLARGFRDLYHCTVSEALVERRLAEARRQLIATDLPVALIGYRNGYQNNAAFTRAFGRRFGLSPSSFRNVGLAA